MKRFCVGIGVFDEDDAETFILAGAPRSSRYLILHGIKNGAVWVKEEKKKGYVARDLAAVSPTAAAILFTKYHVDIPESLVQSLDVEND